MAKPSMVNVTEVGTSDRFDDVYTDFVADEIYSAEREGQQFDFVSKNGVALRVEVFSDTMLRFRYAPKNDFQNDFSYAIQSGFAPKETAIDFIETDHHFELVTAALRCQIVKQHATVRILDLSGKVINEDAAGYLGRYTIHKGMCRVAVTKKSPIHERYYGLGDKSCALDLRGEACDNYNTDAFAYGAGSYPLYRSVPFYYGLNEGLAYGIFMDNSYRSHFEFDTENDGTMTFWAEGGEMNYYFMYGPELTTVARQYHQLTGVTELPPMWALGFHQCRWSYYPDARVRELASDFRKHQVPCDAIYLDIDYMNGWRIFTINTKLFPDMKDLVATLEKEGFSTIVMIDPGIKEDPDYEVYQDGLKEDVYCRRSDGTLMVGPVWPNNCVFPDYTDPRVRDWWASLYEIFYNEYGIAGFWNDMNEPAVFKVNSKTFPDDVLHHHEGYGGNHRKAHNIYGMQMSRATKEGLQNLKPNKRPFVLTRATFSGGQRYAAVWTGDNIASWEHLQIANIQCQRLSISGFSLVGSDVGGFVEYPSGELMVRWMQMGIFHTLYRVHSMGNNADGSGQVMDNIMELDALDRKDQEPWSFGEPYTAINRASVNLRYRLLGYIYSAFYQHSVDGTPVLQSLAFLDQHDEKLYSIERDFMFGKHLLVSPVVRSHAKYQNIYLPKGEWYHFYTEKKYKGGKNIRVATPLEEIPFFVKGGTILPLYPVRQHTKTPVTHLELHLYVGTGDGHLYEDAGDGYAYQDGNYRYLRWESQYTGGVFEVTCTNSGNFAPAYEDYHLHIHTGGKAFKTLVIDGKELPFEQENKHLLRLEIKDVFKILILK